MPFALFWDFTQRRNILTDVSGQPVGPIFRGQKKPDSWSLKIGPIGCPETSVRNYHYSPRNNPAERSSRLLRCGNLKSRITHTIQTLHSATSRSLCLQLLTQPHISLHFAELQYLFADALPARLTINPFNQGSYLVLETQTLNYASHIHNPNGQ